MQYDGMKNFFTMLSISGKKNKCNKMTGLCVCEKHLFNAVTALKASQYNKKASP